MENIKEVKGTQIEETVQETLTYDMEGMDEMTNTAKYTKKDMIIAAAGSGLLMGTGAGTSVWFIERRKRIKLLKAIEEMTESMLARLKYDEEIEKGIKATEKITIGKKEVDLRDIEIDGTGDIANLITNNLINNKVNKKELNRWEKQIQELIKITDQAAVRFENKGKVIEQL